MANSRSGPVHRGSDDGLNTSDQLAHLLRNVIKPLYDEPEAHSYNDMLEAFGRILKIAEITDKETEQ